MSLPYLFLPRPIAYCFAKAGEATRKKDLNIDLKILSVC